MNLASNPEPIRQLLSGRRGVDAWTKSELYENGILQLFDGYPSFGEPNRFDFGLAIDFLVSIGELVEVSDGTELENGSALELAAPGFIVEEGQTRTCLLIGEDEDQTLKVLREFGEIEYRSPLRRYKLHQDGQFESFDALLAYLDLSLATYPTPNIVSGQIAQDVIEATELELKSQRWIVANDQVDVDYILARLTPQTRRDWSKRKVQLGHTNVSDGIFVARIFKNHRRFTSWALLDIESSKVRHAMDFFGNGGFSEAMRIDSALNAAAGLPNVLDVVLTNNKQDVGDSGVARVGLHFPLPNQVRFQLLFLGRTTSAKIPRAMETYEIESGKIHRINDVLSQMCWTEMEIVDDA
jgi:hypothetical protein